MTCGTSSGCGSVAKLRLIQKVAAYKLQYTCTGTSIHPTDADRAREKRKKNLKIILIRVVKIYGRDNMILVELRYAGTTTVRTRIEEEY